MICTCRLCQKDHADRSNTSNGQVCIELLQFTYGTFYEDDIIIWTYEIGYGPTINSAEVESPSINSFGPSISGRVKTLKP
jgi:hypothetical protein